MAHSMIEESVPGMIDRAVARSLRDATKEAGGLIHKEVTSLKMEINQIRQGGQAARQERQLTASMCSLDELPVASTATTCLPDWLHVLQRSAPWAFRLAPASLFDDMRHEQAFTCSCSLNTCSP